MTAERVFRGGTVVLPGGPTQADLAVERGMFSAVGPPGTLDAAEVVDVTGHVLLPGAIDVHVHFRQPGFEYKEDFGTGTRAAACGGVTTVCDMSSTHPPVTSAEQLRAKRALVEESAYVDFGLWAGPIRSRWPRWRGRVRSASRCT